MSPGFYKNKKNQSFNIVSSIKNISKDIWITFQKALAFQFVKHNDSSQEDIVHSVLS